MDTNQWKSFVADRLKTPPAGAGCLTLFRPEPGRTHRMAADHCAAEYPVEVTAKGRTVTEWKDIPGRDNHLWDCLTGATVAASILGLTWSPAGTAEPPKPPRPKLKLSELGARKQAAGAK